MIMVSAVTEGIIVTVRATYEAAPSDPRAARYVFSYRITITNSSRHTVQLLSRHWIIMDSLGPEREVDGPGVVGETPVLDPGQSFTYSSGCELRSSIGRMHGTYLMHRVTDGKRLEVTIPTFDLYFPYISN